MIVVLPFDRTLSTWDNTTRCMGIINSCGIEVDIKNYLGGGSYSGMLWSVGENEKRILMLLLKTGGRFV